MIKEYLQTTDDVSASGVSEYTPSARVPHMAQPAYRLQSSSSRSQMEVKKTTTCALLLVLLVCVSDPAMMPGVEALFGRHCQHASRMFKGLCFVDTNCNSVCAREGYSGGRCHGVRHRCMCC
ncbi:Gamma Purothionin [Canna indica]|uniref:Gamma Purothionin n=1 Tax=Canna indica TaxID=4628 RepID=A0AAQ3QPM1_9LILI|nr:Gamma Purothionin [Canna indica]